MVALLYIYNWLWEHLPDICPKSFSAYSAMKNANSRTFQTIAAEAELLGYQVSRVNTSALSKEDNEANIATELNRDDYLWLEQHIPHLCPKSFSSYMRMKNGNTKKFQSISEAAEELRYEFSARI